MLCFAQPIIVSPSGYLSISPQLFSPVLSCLIQSHPILYCTALHCIEPSFTTRALSFVVVLFCVCIFQALTCPAQARSLTHSLTHSRFPLLPPYCRISNLAKAKRKLPGQDCTAPTTCTAPHAPQHKQGLRCTSQEKGNQKQKQADRQTDRPENKTKEEIRFLTGQQDLSTKTRADQSRPEQRG